MRLYGFLPQGKEELMRIRDNGKRYFRDAAWGRPEAREGIQRRSHRIAFAQTYFAVQTRRAELIQQRLEEAERVSARRKLSATEKKLSLVIFEQTGGNENFAIIRSKGDQALFGRTTQEVNNS